jgi:hypothetical protein
LVEHAGRREGDANLFETTLIGTTAMLYGHSMHDL